MKTKIVPLILLSIITLMGHAEVFDVDGLWYETTSETTVSFIVEPSGGGSFTSKKSYQGDIIIPKTVDHNGVTYTVTAVKATTFNDSPYLISVSIPSTVISLGTAPFMDCPRLETIMVATENPAFVVADGLLYNHDMSMLIACPAARTTEVTVANGATTICRSAFDWCSLVRTIVLPSGVTEIGPRAFYSCNKLTSIVFPDGITLLPDSVMFNCRSLEQVIFPTSLTSIGYKSFYQCDKIKKLELPNSLQTIGDQTFSLCSNITSVSLPIGLKKIGYRAFENCSKLGKITIPSSVEIIATQVFVGCNNLHSIEVDESNEKYSSKDGVLFNKEKTILLCCPSSKMGDYEVPSTVTTIGEYGFYYCRLLDKISLPLSLTKLETGAFRLCNQLRTIILPPYLTTLSEGVFNSCNALNALVCYAPQIPQTISESFTNDNFSVPLYVPAQMLENYKSTNEWAKFETILPITKDVINENMGDTNDDGHVTVNDVLQTTNMVLGIPICNYKWLRGDMNFDGYFTITDVIEIVNLITGE